MPLAGWRHDRTRARRRRRIRAGSCMMQARGQIRLGVRATAAARCDRRAASSLLADRVFVLRGLGERVVERGEIAHQEHVDHHRHEHDAECKSRCARASNSLACRVRRLRRRAASRAGSDNARLRAPGLRNCFVAQSRGYLTLRRRRRAVSRCAPGDWTAISVIAGHDGFARDAREAFVLTKELVSRCDLRANES